jgi:hypothetical protein
MKQIIKKIETILFGKNNWYETMCFVTVLLGSTFLGAAEVSETYASIIILKALAATAYSILIAINCYMLTNVISRY